MRRDAAAAYSRVASRLHHTGLAIEASKLEALLGVLGPRLAGQAPDVGAWWDDEDDPADNGKPYALLDGGIAHIQVMGTLVQRSSGMSGWSGLTSYQGLARTVDQAMADGQVRGLALEVDSAGGEVAGLFDFVDALRAAGTAKPIWAHSNEQAFSAGYAIPSAAEKVWLTRTAGVGSIGVISLHVDRSGADKQAGLKFTYFYAGNRKADFNPHEPVSKEAGAAWQAEIERVNDIFCGTVARHRGMTVEAVKGLEAGIFWGPSAIEAGLADQVGTFDEMVAAMRGRLAPNRTPALIGGARPAGRALQPAPGGATFLTPRGKGAAPTQESTMDDTDEKAPVVTGQNDKPKGEAKPTGDGGANVVALDSARKQGFAEAMATAAKVRGLCKLAGMADKADEFIEKVAGGMTLDAVQDALLKAQADKADATAIAGQHGSTTQLAADKANNYGWDKAFARAGIKLRG